MANIIQLFEWSGLVVFCIEILQMNVNHSNYNIDKLYVVL